MRPHLGNSKRNSTARKREKRREERRRRRNVRTRARFEGFTEDFYNKLSSIGYKLHCVAAIKSCVKEEVMGR